MKIMRQQLRQPIKTVLGIMLVILAVSVLLITAEQALTAITASKTVEHQFSTVALTTPLFTVWDFAQTGLNTINNQIGFSQKSYLPKDILLWTEQLISPKSDLVNLDSHPGLASAYVSELTADNVTRHEFHLPLELSVTEGAAAVVPIPIGVPYSSSLLEIVVVDLEQKMLSTVNEDGTVTETPSAEWNLIGEIANVHSLQSGYNDPTGWTLRISLFVPAPSIDINDPNQEAIAQYEKEKDALGKYVQGLQIGQHYLVYGLDYYDADWELRESIRMEYANRVYGAEDVIIDAFDPEKLIPLTEKEIEQNKASKPYYYDVAEYLHEYKRISLTEREVSAFRSVWMTNPKLMLLEGSAEDFLTSEEGIQWAKYLEYAQINAHAFPVIGVDKLGYIAPFAQESARVVEGRDFTQEELDNGAKVCVMAQSLAAANGLAVGDTINPRYYNFDPEAEGQYLVSDGWGTTNPAAYFYGENTPWAGETEEYTIVGLYRYDSEWGDPQEDLYSFTPNTIFVPKNSVTGTMDYGDQAFFRTIVLENGKVEEFAQLVNEAGYEGLFVYYDQGYSEVIDTFYDYESSAKRVAVIGGAVYGVLLLLFLLLFPARHGKTLATMSSLGAPRGKKYAYVVGSTLALLIPGTMIGTAAGLLLWRQVTEALMQSAKVMLDMEFNVGSLLLVAAAQLLFALCLVLIIAIPASKGNSLMRRK